METFPDVKVTGLIFSDPNETGTSECKSCTASRPQTTDSTASNYCNSGKKFFAFDYRNPNQDNVPVISTSKPVNLDQPLTQLVRWRNFKQPFLNQ